MRGEWSIYNTATRLIVSHWRGDSEQLAQNIPADHSAIAGLYDPLSKCLAANSEDVIDYVPQQPDEFYEWDDNAKRWKLSESRLQSIHADIMAREKLADLDQKALRALIEDKLGIKPTKADVDAGAMTLDQIQAAQAEERKNVMKDEP
jgi:hypothetical protein